MAAGSASELDRMRELLNSYYGDLDDDEEEEEEDQEEEAAGYTYTDQDTGRQQSYASKTQRQQTRYSSSQALNIDKPAFDPTAFLREQLSSKSLPELAAYDEKLAMDTKSLDANMQNLVYENYNKFIGATDTIREMRHSVGEIESEMEHLNSHMSELKNKNDSLNEKLGPNIGKTEQLVGVRRLLQRLEFLFDLPVRLKRCIELNALSQAVRSYNVAADVLRRYSHVPSLHQIYVDASKTIEDLKVQLRSQIESADKATSSQKAISDVIEAIQLLVQLKEPHSQLRGLFLTWQRQHLLGVLDRFIASYQENARNSLTQQYGDDTKILSIEDDEELRNVIPEDILQANISHKYLFEDSYDFVRQLNYHFLDSLVEAVRKFESLFGQDQLEGNEQQQELTVESVCQELLNAYLTKLKQHLSLPPIELCLPMLRRSADRSGGLSKKNETSEEVAGEEAERPQNDFSDNEEEDENNSSERTQELSSYRSLMSGLELLLNDIRRVSSSLPIKRLIDRGTELAEKVLRHQINVLFARCRATLIKRLLHVCGPQNMKSIETEEERSEQHRRHSSEFHGSSGENIEEKSHWRVQFGSRLYQQADESYTYILEDIKYILASTKPLVHGGMQLIPDIAQEFVVLAQGQTKQILLWICSACETFGDPFHPARVGSEYILTDLSESAEVEDHGYDGQSVWGMRRRNMVYIPEWTKDVPEGSILVLSMLCKYLGDKGVKDAVGYLHNALPEERELDSLVGEEGPGIGRLSTQTDPSNLSKRAYIGSSYLISTFLRKHCDKVSATLRHGVRTVDWLNISEPRSCQLAVRLCLQEIIEARQIIAGISGQAGLLSPSSRRKAAGAPDRKAMLGLSGGVGGELSKWVKKPRENSFTGKFGDESAMDFEKNIERMLSSDKGGSGSTDVSLQQLLSHHPFDLNVLTTIIMRHTLLTFEGCLSGNFLSNYGIQQVQVDIATLHFACTEYWQLPKEREEILDRLFNGVLTQAVQRFYTDEETVRISPMAPNIVYSVASQVCKDLFHA